MSKIYLVNNGLIQYIDGKIVGNGESIFANCSNVTSFTGDLSSLTNGNNMFSSCSNLHTFDSDLSSLTSAYSMFYGTKLTSFTGDLSSLTDGRSMFSGCSNLTSFTGDLSSLTDGGSMFYGAKILTSFTGDLSSLTNGSSMFGSSTSNCTALNLASIENISETINDLAAQGKTGTIHIGMSKTLQSDDSAAPVNVALAAIRAKGWTVTEIYHKTL